MSEKLKIEMMIISLVIFISVLVSIRKNKLETQDSIFWIFLAVVLLVGAFFDNLVIKATSLLGIETPSNLVFFLGILTLFYLAFKNSIKLSKKDRQIRKLIQEVSLLKKKIEEINKDEK